MRAAKFRRGRKSLEDDPRSGCPETTTSEENVDRVQNIVTDDRRLTIHQIVNAFGISRETVENSLLNELSMTKASARWVTPDQKYTGLITSRENLTLFEADQAGFLDSFLSQGDCWVHHFEPETK
ncbi:protein GVQW3-like [Octopus sinensis]|uniref:Protein GVQW3-like n=1 Tax=Octopus sinensis TaxID=2607531 RepID=A0A6P7SYI2_9MOLL|nr:protein GVQW3-like [Octopus sinensis]